MEVVIGDKKFVLKPLNYLAVAFDLPKIEDAKERHIKTLELSGLKKEEIESLSVLEGKQLMEQVNDLNGFNTDFQKTLKRDEAS